jgi:hypothetical protein
VDVLKAHFAAEDRLLHKKMNQREMSMYTRAFMDNGVGDGDPLEFVVRDLDYEPEDPKKPGLFLVQ